MSAEIEAAARLLEEAIQHGGDSLDGVDPAVRYVARAATVEALEQIAKALTSVAEYDSRTTRERELLFDVAEKLVDRALALGARK